MITTEKKGLFKSLTESAQSHFDSFHLFWVFSSYRNKVRIEIVCMFAREKNNGISLQMAQKSLRITFSSLFRQLSQPKKATQKLFETTRWSFTVHERGSLEIYRRDLRKKSLLMFLHFFFNCGITQFVSGWTKRDASFVHFYSSSSPRVQKEKKRGRPRKCRRDMKDSSWN